jgi:hypothetical protein
VCKGVPPFLYMGDEEQKRILDLSEHLEYYEIQNLLHYMLKEEDLLKGVFPRISLEILYINLFNLSRLRDVEKAIDDLGRQDVIERPPQVRQERRETASIPAGHSVTEPERPEESAKPRPATEKKPEEPRRLDEVGFIEYLKSRKPMAGSLLANLKVEMTEDSLVIYMEKSAMLLEDSGQKEEIGELLRQFFGREMGLVFKDGGDIKRNGLEDFMREAETLFNK